MSGDKSKLLIFIVTDNNIIFRTIILPKIIHARLAVWFIDAFASYWSMLLMLTDQHHDIVRFKLNVPYESSSVCRIILDILDIHIMHVGVASRK